MSCPSVSFGQMRVLGAPALADKIVQYATVELLNVIYEQDFLGSSYEFRPSRSLHQSLEAPAVVGALPLAGGGLGIVPGSRAEKP